MKWYNNVNLIEEGVDENIDELFVWRSEDWRSKMKIIFWLYEIESLLISGGWTSINDYGYYNNENWVLIAIERRYIAILIDCLPALRRFLPGYRTRIFLGLPPRVFLR